MMIDHAFKGSVEFIHEGRPFTRFYFPYDTAAPVTPTSLGDWDDTSQATYRKLEPSKTTETITIGSLITNGASLATVDRVYVSDPMRAQSLPIISFKMQIQSVASFANTQPYLTLRIVSNDGLTLKDEWTAVNDYGPGTFIDTPTENKTWANGDSLKAVTFEDGDRLVVVLGYFNNVLDVRARCVYGNPASTDDLPENETQTTTGVGWIEFSTALQLQ